MASQDLDLYMAGVDEILICRQCMGQYDDPRTLPCGHTFCKKCLQQLCEQQSDNKLQCPECRVECQIPANSADGFPKNFMLQDLLDKRQAALNRMAAESRDGSKCFIHLLNNAIIM